MPANLNLEVTTLTDVVNANDGVLSLREAINATNDEAPTTSHTITFASNLAGGTLTLSDAANYRELTITKAVHIDSPSNRITIQRDQNSSVRHRLFTIQGTWAQFSDLILRRGSVIGSGGAISVSNSDLILINCTVNNNHADGSGGAIVVTLGEGSNGSLTAFDSEIVSNTTESLGGGVYAGSGTNVTLDNTDLSGNEADGYGGGAFLLGNGTVRNGSTVSGNEANIIGGGIFASPGSGGSLTVQDSTISGNTAQGAQSKGGGVYLGSGSITLNTVTIANNSANLGDGMYRVFGTSSSATNVTYTNDSEYVEPAPGGDD